MGQDIDYAAVIADLESRRNAIDQTILTIRGVLSIPRETRLRQNFYTPHAPGLRKSTPTGSHVLSSLPATASPTHADVDTFSTQPEAGNKTTNRP